jgi:protoheme IX farnesyltransferase
MGDKLFTGPPPSLLSVPVCRFTALAAGLHTRMARIRFHQYAWGLLGYTLLVVLGGAFVRATISGDGCGNHWPDCNGQLLPDLGRMKTVIEFSHRASTVLLLPLVLALVVWAFRGFRRGHPARTGAVLVLAMTLVEALIGAALVRFRLVGHDQSVYRAVVMPAHLIATFLLLMVLTLTAWWGGGGGWRVRGQGSLAWALGLGLIATVFLAVSGAITALGDTLFPAGSLREGLRQDFSPSAHFLLALRVYHPLIAIGVGSYLALLAGFTARSRPAAPVPGFARAVAILVLAQLMAGAMNLTLLAPVWMQLLHLLLADLVWVSLVLMAAAAQAQSAVGSRQSIVDSRQSVVDGRRSMVDGSDTALPLAGDRKAATWRDYLELTKPRVISLLLLTTLAAMFIAAAGETGPGPGFATYLAVAIGLYMAAGSANAINMALERDLDERMGRTARRPTVTQRIPARSALLFAVALAAGSFAILWAAANLLSACLALAGLLFYIFVYTLLLKRRTPSNIVIGGAAGAFPPLVGWAAVTGHLGPMAWCLFGIVFLWTPVHFWALAILIKEDYARAGVPMLPVVRGERATVAHIACYTVLTVAISALPLALQGKNGQAAAGWFYLAAAALLDGALLLRSAQLFYHPDRPQARSLFRYSMVYLALLFLALAIDRAHWIWGRV